MKNLRGSNAIVTGASRGIGPYIAKTLAAQGVNVALAARSAERLEDTRRACEALGVRAIAVPTDVTSMSDLQRLVDTAQRELGAVDILVNNAGIETTGAIDTVSFDQVDDLLRTNLNAPIWLSKMVLPGMLARKRGAIVHVSSMAGKSGAPYNSTYSASKFGLNGFSEAVNFELEGTGVHMSVVCPGFVSEAGMWKNRGGTAPRLTREVSPQKVADGVLKAVRGSREVLVMAAPIRPLLALAQLAPGLQRGIVKRMGVVDAMREGADRPAAVPDREPADTAPRR
jgi:short-subunit dehydrogenase